MHDINNVMMPGILTKMFPFNTSNHATALMSKKHVHCDGLMEGTMPPLPTQARFLKVSCITSR